MQAGNGALGRLEEHAALRSLTRHSLRRSVSARPVFRSPSIAPAATSRSTAAGSPPSFAASSAHQRPPPAHWARHSMSSAAATTPGLDSSHLQRVSTPPSSMLSRKLPLKRKAALAPDAEGGNPERGVLDSGDHDVSSDSDSECPVRTAHEFHRKTYRPRSVFRRCTDRTLTAKFQISLTASGVHRCTTAGSCIQNSGGGKSC